MKKLLIITTISLCNTVWSMDNTTKQNNTPESTIKMTIKEAQFKRYHPIHSPDWDTDQRASFHHQVTTPDWNTVIETFTDNHNPAQIRKIEITRTRQNSHTLDRSELFVVHRAKL